MRANNIAGTPQQVHDRIEHFALDLIRLGRGKIREQVFLERRLRHGVYGQRQDGAYMMRSKLPLGLVDAEQLEAFADISERFGSGIAHLTTRQDIQVHFVPLHRSPEVMRVLAEQEVSTREACGNVVRNVSASPLAGVTPTEAFDVTPYGLRLAEFLLEHAAGQSLGRKFKITLAGCDDGRFNLAALHDIGLTARRQQGRRGFHLVVGGGLGPVPHRAQLFDSFVPAEELLPLCQSILLLFQREGEKKNRARARMKFLVAKLGIAEFRRRVWEIRASLPEDRGWRMFDLDRGGDEPRALQSLPTERCLQGFKQKDQSWLRSNVLKQRQEGYATVLIRVPRGDLSPRQLRGLAHVMRTITGNTLRIGLDQSLVLRWVPWSRLLEVYGALNVLSLGQARAGGLGDTVTCPGADTCKLGITKPRSQARSIQSVLDRLAHNPDLEKLRIHISGCPNACAQHQIADIGFYGGARSIQGTTAPHYMLFLGGYAGGRSPQEEALPKTPEGEEQKEGTTDERSEVGFGSVVTKVPAHRVADAIELLCGLYLEEARRDGSGLETFGTYVRRQGLRRFKILLAPLQHLPPSTQAPWMYREPGEDVAFVVARGVGECEGMPVSQSDFLLQDSEHELERAQESFERGDLPELTAGFARRCMLLAARALLSSEGVLSEDPVEIESRFRTLFYDSGRIFEGVGFYFLSCLQEKSHEQSGDRLRRLVSEAGLFVEETHSLLAQRALPRGTP